MRTFINVLLGLCILHLFVNFSKTVDASRRPWAAANNRRTRSVSKPLPINCKLGNWSPWTPCNSCTDKAFRFRYLEKPSQFSGLRCIDTLWDKLYCPRATTQCMVPDYCGESFTCKETGRCISQSLRCNGEPDCDDFSDEDECESFNRREDKCSTLMPIPGAERGTQGYNILTGDSVDQVLDWKYFGGKCEYVYNGEWRKFRYDAFCESLDYNDELKNYRKPYNYLRYRFVAEATSEGTHEYYEDLQSLLNARKTLSSFNLGISAGVYYVEAGMSGSKESEFLNNVTKFNSQDLGFIRLWSKVQTALFKMRTNQLMLHEDLYVSLMDLPENYDFGMYSRFMNTFGTHYVTEGTMGGKLEYVFVVNKTEMEKTNVDSDRAKTCIGASVGISYPISDSSSLGFKVKGKGCEADTHITKDNVTGSSFIKDVVTLVKGGITETSAGLLTIRNPDTYRKWGASLKYHPALIEYETMPIYELVRLSTAADNAGVRVANLKRAFDEYLQQFDACRCAPCRHNGIPVLSGTSCSCICKSGFDGQACERTLRRDAKTDGSWSCWGSWSSCTSGRKTRTRSCNNPAPDGGGITCLGSPTQTQRC
ncbi:complement component C8 alpha chain [Leuresthes tenuis]|uniref:complement component C8 alpha chain n=1 Tax=Leuresthes tenuis TaxID=355514 RepID=UPI003B50A044